VPAYPGGAELLDDEEFDLLGDVDPGTDLDPDEPAEAGRHGSRNGSGPAPGDDVRTSGRAVR
jgi:hypothetical protein